VELIETGHFSQGDRGLFKPLVDNLMGRDPFFVMADLADYWRAQAEVASLWRDQARWQMSSVLNSARSGYFSSDRAIADYANTIWHVQPLSLAMDASEQHRPARGSEGGGCTTG
jgi:starch phosphorylase